MASVTINVKVAIDIRQDGPLFVARCERFGVVTQGSTYEEAKANLIEAVSLFIETCYEMGTLETVLKEAGFLPATGKEENRDDGPNHIELSCRSLPATTPGNAAHNPHPMESVRLHSPSPRLSFLPPEGQPPGVHQGRLASPQRLNNGRNRGQGSLLQRHPSVSERAMPSIIAGKVPKMIGPTLA